MDKGKYQQNVLIKYKCNSKTNIIYGNLTNTKYFKYTNCNLFDWIVSYVNQYNSEIKKTQTISYDYCDENYADYFEVKICLKKYEPKI